MIILRPDILLQIEELFINKKWSTSIGTAQNLSLFDKFCRRIGLLKPDEQKFIIQLTQKFVVIGLQDYLEKFYDSIFCLSEDIFETKQSIFVYPLLNPYLKVKKDLIPDGLVKEIKIPRDKTKSGGFLHYMFENDDWTWITNKFIHSSSLQTLMKNFDNNNSTLLLVDDFVGSGKTAVDICKVYLSEDFNGSKIHPDNMKVVCIAAQREGIRHVKESIGVDVVSNIELDKGLSDFTSSAELGIKLKMMTDLEDKIGVTLEYNLGYEKSESLISFLNKTPNNTFPVYWWETQTKVAPFPRYNKFITDE